jgi:hypothetical protein
VSNVDAVKVCSKDEDESAWNNIAETTEMIEVVAGSEWKAIVKDGRSALS